MFRYPHHTKEGIPELLEMILLTAEVMELKANPNRAARGLVIEAKLDKGTRICGYRSGAERNASCGRRDCGRKRPRPCKSHDGRQRRRVKEAGPSQPVEILG